jgi:glycosyltransferase involved in cell wall biosynthesis
MPRVSVIMTVYNGGPYLRPAVDSLLAQTFTDWELVAVENGSTDGSKRVLAEYGDPRIRVIDLPANIGRTPALNLAFSHATGEYVANLDADDLCSPERLERQVAHLNNHPDLGLLGTWCTMIGPDGQPLAKFEPVCEPASVRDQLAYDNPIAHSAAMFRRSAAQSIGGYPSDTVYAQDFALWLRFAAHGYGIANLPEHLVDLRTHPNRATNLSDYRIARTSEAVKLFRQSMALGGYSMVARRLARRTMGAARGRYGLALIAEKRLFAGILQLVWGLALAPKVYMDTPAVRRWTGLGFLSNVSRPLRHRLRATLAAYRGGRQ